MLPNRGAKNEPAEAKKVEGGPIPLRGSSDVSGRRDPL